MVYLRTVIVIYNIGLGCNQARGSLSLLGWNLRPPVSGLEAIVPTTWEKIVPFAATAIMPMFLTPIVVDALRRHKAGLNPGRCGRLKCLTKVNKSSSSEQPKLTEYTHGPVSSGSAVDAKGCD